MEIDIKRDLRNKIPLLFLLIVIFERRNIMRIKGITPEENYVVYKYMPKMDLLLCLSDTVSFLEACHHCELYNQRPSECVYLIHDRAYDEWWIWNDGEVTLATDKFYAA